MDRFITGVINFFAEPIRKYVVDHLCYIVQAGDNVKALRREVEILEEKRKDVELKIQRDDAALKKPTSQVDGWLKRTNELTARSKQIEDDYKSRSCMLGSCSLNCFSNHSIGMWAVEELNNVRQERASIEGVGQYTIEMPLPAVQAKSTTTVEFGWDVFKSKLNQALGFLEGGGDIINEEGRLGVWGMGGVGKTTLLEHINNELEKSPSSFGFDRVLFVTATKYCRDGNMLLKLIIKTLRLPEGSNKDDVLNYLRNKNFAFLLDDLWVHVDLKDAGIPLPLGVGAATNNCKCKRKLILTSRLYNVCSKMGATQFINVECLPSDDARRLFHAHAGLQDNDAMASSELWKLANVASDECDGLPLALVATGRAMSGTEDISVWRNAIDLLRESKISQIPGMDDDPLPLLKFSYDHLAVRERECLLHCALWPEDWEIDARELIRCWLGHGLLGEHSTLQKACDAGYAVINSLQKACLVEGIKYRGAPQLGYEHVKLHDVIRDMGLWIAREYGAKEMKWVVTSGANVMATLPQDQNAWRQVHKMSIFSASPIKDIQLDCPNITTLMLSNTVFELSNIQHMHGLKYLELQTGAFPKGGFPIEICGMEQLEYLNIGWSNIKLFPKEVTNLRNMKFLLCRHSVISSLPDDFFPSLANLFELDLFSYKFTSQSSIIDQLVHSRQKGGSSRLKSLGINASSILDLQNLTRLSTSYGVSIRTLHIGGINDLISDSLHLLSTKSFGSQMMFSNMENLVITDSDQHLKQIVIEDEHRLCSLEYFEIQDALDLENIIWKGVEPAAVFPRLREIKIGGCGLRHVTWAASLPCLDYLGVYECRDMEELVVWDGNEGIEEENNSGFPFPCLRTIALEDMHKLTRFFAGELSLRSLESLSVIDCPKLESLPFNSTASCSRLSYITGEEEWWKALQLKENIRTFLEPFFLEAYT